MREQFEEKYREMRPDDKSTLMPNGNYSGWVKQASWERWQMNGCDHEWFDQTFIGQSERSFACRHCSKVKTVPFGFNGVSFAPE